MLRSRRTRRKCPVCVSLSRVYVVVVEIIAVMQDRVLHNKPSSKGHMVVEVRAHCWWIPQRAARNLPSSTSISSWRDISQEISRKKKVLIQGTCALLSYFLLLPLRVSGACVELKRHFKPLAVFVQGTRYSTVVACETGRLDCAKSSGFGHGDASQDRSSHDLPRVSLHTFIHLLSPSIGTRIQGSRKKPQSTRGEPRDLSWENGSSIKNGS